MCGIAGVFGLSANREHLVSLGEKMIAVLHHRGPDGFGVWCGSQDGVVLAHRRLAIQDLSSSGAQPKISATGRFCITFNGEIYNFQELRSQLIKLGHSFEGYSDTEVMLAAIEEWGVERAVSYFVGMFAFALWDNKEKTLHLCRDRLGEKPLYYGWRNDLFYFASELTAIEKVVNKKQLEIDTHALANFFHYGYINAPLSIYQGIYKLIPGTILTLTSHNGDQRTHFSAQADTTPFSPKTYWSVLQAANQGLASRIENEEQVVHQLDELLHRTVKRQLIADVRVGTFLSGGIDSSLVAAVAQSVSSEPIKTFTIGFDNAEYDESIFAARIAQHLGTEHTTLQVTAKDGLDLIPKLGSIYDEPFADSSQIPAYLVSKLAKEHVTVCLSGDGGDELFAGYNRYLYLVRIWKKIGFIPHYLRKQIGVGLSQPSVEFWDQLYTKLSSQKNTEKRQRLVGLKIQKLAGLLQKRTELDAYDYLLSFWDDPQELLNVIIPSAPAAALPFGANLMEQVMFLDQVNYIPGDNLAKVDRASMAHSLETRLPLLSHELVEYSWHLPVAMKAKGDQSKWILKKVLEKYVPRELTERPKMGFSVPVGEWLRGELREWAHELISNADKKSNALLNKEVLLHIWREHLSGRRDYSLRLWAVLMFLAWLECRR